MIGQAIAATAIGRGACAAILLILWNPYPAPAQDAASPQAVPAQATATPVKIEGAAAEPKAGEAKPGEGKPGEGKPAEGKPGETKPGEGKPAEGKPGEGKPGEGKPAEAAVTQRPAKPPTAPDPDELKVRPNEEGKYRFSFKGQPWPEVLEWVATISNMSLDWQELPGDFLNLSTQQAYTVEEIRDLINRHLLSRGFTMLRQGEILTVVNLKKLDPALVARISLDELASRSPNEFVKVSFPLDWMLADTAAEELKPMLSPNGKLNPLKSTNRLEAVDAVSNLREIHALLTQEQSNTGQERLVREFTLMHARATEVEKQLQTLLGIEDKSKKSSRPMSPEEMQALQQQQMMMQQEMQQRGGQPRPPSDKPKAEPVNLVVNSRKNSIVASAPPDKMAIIEQAVKLLDVQMEGGQLLSNMNRMQVYRLSAIDPEPLVTTLNDLGVLDPATRLQVDRKNRSIIAYASLADHVTIRALVSKLDGSGRRFEVIQLRRLEADYVAGSIDFMMNGAEKETNQPRRPYYYDFGYYGGRSQQDESTKDRFRVDADVENNRLMVWASSVELEEVNNLLAKLGEIPARGGNSTTRVLRLEPGKDGRDALERLKRAWPRLSPNPLVTPDEETRRDPPERPTRRSQPDATAVPDSQTTLLEQPGAPDIAPPAEAAKESPAPAKFAANRVPARSESVVEVALADTSPADKAAEGEVAPSTGADSSIGEAPTGAAAEPASESPRPYRTRGSQPADAAEPPPIEVRQGPGGEWIVDSADTAALDLLEDVVSQFAPPRRDYRVFYLKHAGASWVTIKLEDFFEVDDKKKTSRNNRIDSWIFGYSPSSEKSDGSRRLSKRKSLKFISEPDTNTILVQGADPAQLRLIEEIIELYDQPEPVNSKAARVTTTYTLKYSKARIVGEAVKDVFRDLLSSNDKALQGNEQQQKNKRPDSQNVYITNLGGEGEDEKRTQVNFKGKLSIGVDELSNSLIVSAEGENLMHNVSRIIQTLDEAAMPGRATVKVVQLGKYMDSDDVRKALSRVLGNDTNGRKSSSEEETSSQQRNRNRADQQQRQQNRRGPGQGAPNGNGYNGNGGNGGGNGGY